MRYGVIIAMVLMVSLSACSKPKIGTATGNFLFKPASLDFDPPDGPPEYQQGWLDGCESGLASYSDAMAKSLKVYKLKQDPNLRNNKMYYQIWKDAFLYCATYLEANNKWKI